MSSSSLDLPYAGVKDWLISRQKLPNNYQVYLNAIYTEIINSLRNLATDLDLPKNSPIFSYPTSTTSTTSLPSLKSNSAKDFLKKKLAIRETSFDEKNPLDYLSICEMIKLLETDEEGKERNFLQQYTSPHITQWTRIRKSYERHNLFIPEMHNKLMNILNYEVPLMRKKIENITQNITEIDRKIKQILGCSVLNDAITQHKNFCSQYDVPITVSYAIKDGTLKVSFTGLHDNYEENEKKNINLSELKDSVSEPLRAIYKNYVISYCRKKIPNQCEEVIRILRIIGQKCLDLFHLVDKNTKFDCIELLVKHGNVTIEKGRELSPNFQRKYIDYAKNSGNNSKKHEINIVISEDSSENDSVYNLSSCLLLEAIGRQILVAELAQICSFLWQELCQCNPNFASSDDCKVAVKIADMALKTNENFEIVATNMMENTFNAKFTNNQEKTLATGAQYTSIFLFFGVCKYLIDLLQADAYLDAMKLISEKTKVDELATKGVFLHWNCVKQELLYDKYVSDKKDLEEELSKHQEDFTKIRMTVRSTREECEKELSTLLGKKVSLIGDIRRI